MFSPRILRFDFCGHRISFILHYQYTLLWIAVPMLNTIGIVQRWCNKLAEVLGLGWDKSISRSWLELCQNFNSLTGTFTKLSSKPGDKEAQTSCKEIKENVYPAQTTVLDQIRDHQYQTFRSNYWSVLVTTLWQESVCITFQIYLRKRDSLE